MLFLHRPRTCPEEPGCTQTHNKQNQAKNLYENTSICSLTRIQKEQDQQLNTKKTIKDTKRRITTRVSLQSLRELQFQKVINQNRYTLNLSQSQKYSSLPKISAVPEIRHTLVSEQAFEHYKRVNTINGQYQYALKQLQKLEEQKIYKLKIQNKMKIKTRKNIYEMQKKDAIEDIYDLFIFANHKKTNSYERQIDPLVKNMDKIDNLATNKDKSISKLDSKWKLGDFFDPIIYDQNEDFGKIENIKKRLSFLGKMQKITNACNEVEVQNKTKNYLNLFTKYSEKLSSTLHKKTKKLEKVQRVFRE